MDNFLFDTYKNSVIPHGRHIYATASDMSMATICAYRPYQHSLPQCKFVLSFLPIAHVFILQAKNQICIIPTHLLQYVFIFITYLHVVKCMEEAHWM